MNYSGLHRVLAILPKGRSLLSLFVFLIVMLLIRDGFSQITTTAADHQTVWVGIDASASELKINGTTNVNTFTCVYTGQLQTDSLELRVIPADTTKILRGAHLKLRVKDFDCGKSKMNEDFYELLQSEKNPFIYLDIAELWKKREKPDHSKTTFETQTIFTIAGVTNRYQVQAHYHPAKNSFTVKGQHQLDITEFGLEPPKKFLGLVKVDKYVTIVFELKMTLDRSSIKQEASSL